MVFGSRILFQVQPARFDHNQHRYFEGFFVGVVLQFQIDHLSDLNAPELYRRSRRKPSDRSVELQEKEFFFSVVFFFSRHPGWRKV